MAKTMGAFINKLRLNKDIYYRFLLLSNNIQNNFKNTKYFVFIILAYIFISYNISINAFE